MNEIYLLLMVFLSGCIYYIVRNRLAIFFPSFPAMIRIIEELADVREDDVVYDLGSGDGRILESFCKKKVRCIGIEHNKLLNRLAMERLQGYNNVKIVQGNIFDHDISNAAVIVAYLSRFVTKDLQKKIQKECKKGTKVIIVSYKFDNWEPVEMKKWMWLPIRLYIVQ